jgi:hypothetical protein
MRDAQRQVVDTVNDTQSPMDPERRAGDDLHRG